MFDDRVACCDARIDKDEERGSLADIVLDFSDWRQALEDSPRTRRFAKDSKKLREIMVVVLKPSKELSAFQIEPENLPRPRDCHDPQCDLETGRCKTIGKPGPSGR